MTVQMTPPTPANAARETESELAHDAEIDLTNCEREPIHIPGRIQPFGYLLAFTPDFIVTHASDNIDAVAGRKADTLIGDALDSVLPADTIDLIRSRMQALQTRDAVERLFGKDVFGTGAPFDMALHLSGRTIVLELEHSNEGQATDFVGFVRPMIERVQSADSVEAACQMAARQLRALTGYDRVMVYKLDANHSGEVIAEAKAPHVETSYLNLRYPASDIPSQARAMYLRNLLRIIADVDADPVDIHPAPTAATPPLDLSISTTRAVSPIHLEYLRNMGVQATLVISVVVRGRLWGMLACHHYEVRELSYEVRTAAELFAQLFAFALDQKTGDARREEMVRARIIHDQVMASLADGATITDSFDTIADAISTVIPHDGIAGWVDGTFTARGETPTHEQFLPLARRLNTTPTGEIYATNEIATLHPEAEDFVGQAAGMLAIPVSRRPRDYLVLFRREAARDVIWAGNPDKPVELGPNGVRLQPRKSFDAWTQTVHGQSLPWTEGEVGAAESLRMTLLEVVLRMTDQAVKERTRAQEQQELLIAELNHRVRNILKLIQGLVAQSKGANSVSQFTETVGGRIHALARAHDQITRENWNSASLYELLETEAEAYLGDKRDRVRIAGPDALLTPQAFTTISLVVHEMMTNAMKYGSISDSRGSVDVTLGTTAAGDLLIGWVERGGPPVSSPGRRGFGTTIIDRSIPFELKGEAHVAYETEGVRGSFRIPAEYITEFRERETDCEMANDNGPDEVRIDGKALVVEDNLIIALDAEDMLREIGASDVIVAADVESGLAAAATGEICFAILDVNLGNETSAKIAEDLASRGVPFVFATGYGESTRMASDMPDVPIVQKPYGKANITEAITKLG